MNVEIGAEAALFPEKEYIKGIFVAVWNSFSLHVLPLHSASPRLTPTHFIHPYSPFNESYSDLLSLSPPPPTAFLFLTLSVMDILGRK